MKKSVILSILVIYILAVFVVGFIGQKLKVYDPTIYVEEIVCESEGFKEEISDELKAKGYIGKISVNYEEGLKIQIKCRVKPDNATYPNLLYSLNSKICTMEVIDGIAVLTFTDSGIVDVIVTSSDTRKKSVKIKVIVSDLGEII